MKKKQCTKCGDEKSLDKFSRNKSSKDGRYSLCKKCKSDYKKELKASDPERYLALARGCGKRYEARHPERIKAQQEAAKKRHAQKPEVIKARQEREAKKRDKALHPEKYKAQKNEAAKRRHALLSAEDREKINAQRRTRYANDSEFKAKEIERDKKRRPQQHEAYKKRRDRDPEGLRAKRRAYEAENREKTNARQRSYYAKNPGKIRAQGRKSRHKTKGDITKYKIMIAASILKKQFMKGVEDGNTKDK